ncbi:hypothetical protein BT69DRAFT_1326009 [Atractiella rhizophila]|nr:hypothetical protein BT69DRAFT_1326009 [Atractiella rhizophila]
MVHCFARMGSGSTLGSDYGSAPFSRSKAELSSKRSRSNNIDQIESNEMEETHPSLGLNRIKGITLQRRNGVPVLGSRRVREVLLAAVFPEFFTTQEVDALHSLLDEAWTARCHFFGQRNVKPHRYRFMWRCRTGYFESIQWAGSPSDDPLGLSPWWAGGIISGLLNEMPQEYNEHLGPCLEVKMAINVMTGMESVP